MHNRSALGSLIAVDRRRDGSQGQTFTVVERIKTGWMQTSTCAKRQELRRHRRRKSQALES